MRNTEDSQSLSIDNESTFTTRSFSKISVPFVLILAA